MAGLAPHCELCGKLWGPAEILRSKPPMHQKPNHLDQQHLLFSPARSRRRQQTWLQQFRFLLLCLNCCSSWPPGRLVEHTHGAVEVIPLAGRIALAARAPTSRVLIPGNLSCCCRFERSRTFRGTPSWWCWPTSTCAVVCEGLGAMLAVLRPRMIFALEEALCFQARFLKDRGKALRLGR